MDYTYETKKINTSAVVIGITAEYKYVIYVAKVNINGEEIIAKSIPYSKKRKLLEIGTIIDVNYWQSPRGLSKNFEILNTKQLPLSQVAYNDFIQVFGLVFMGTLDLILLFMIIGKLI